MAPSAPRRIHRTFPSTPSFLSSMLVVDGVTLRPSDPSWTTRACLVTSQLGEKKLPSRDLASISIEPTSWSRRATWTRTSDGHGERHAGRREGERDSRAFHRDERVRGGRKTRENDVDEARRTKDGPTWSIRTWSCPAENVEAVCSTDANATRIHAGVADVPCEPGTSWRRSSPSCSRRCANWV